MKKPDVYERTLREVFWDGDRELAARVARLCVLFEDLRIESIGVDQHSDARGFDALNRQYRCFYFLRRSLVTLDEFCGALNRLNEMRTWHRHITRHQNKELRCLWTEAVTFFNGKKERYATIRGDMGAHYPEATARWAIDTLGVRATGTFEIVYDDEETADTKLHFSTELVARAILRTADHQLTDDEIAKFIEGVLADVRTGWTHAVNAVHVVILEYLARRFMGVGSQV
jgi:hypothetical protein